MRLSTTGYGDAKSVEVYVMLLAARAPNGEERKYLPELSAPECSSASGFLSAIPLSEIFVADLMHRPGFRVLMITAGAIPTNKSAIRALIAELQVYPQLIILPTICSPHTLCNATKWVIGEFPYGVYLGTAHGLGAVRCRDFDDRIDRMLRFDAPLLGESLLASNTFVDYVGCIQNAYTVPASSSTNNPGTDAFDGRVAMRDICRLFAKLVTGRRGPFAKEGVQKRRRIYPTGASICGHLGRQKTVNCGTAAQEGLKKIAPML